MAGTGDLRGFLTIKRAEPQRRPVPERTKDWREFYVPTPDDHFRTQGARCMDCGVPFCQGDTGCPVQNVIPEWNALVRDGRWRDASLALHATNNFPELTGRLCPAPCESACVLGLIEQPVAIRNIEQAIADKSFQEGWIVPAPTAPDSGYRVAVVGSGPAGLAAAQQLRRLGHAVVVFEKDDRIGGLLRYGIPDFKLEKDVIERRLRQLEAEGVAFEPGVEVGRDLSVQRLRDEFDAVLLAGGAQQARDLLVPGRELGGVHFAMDYLTQQNRRVAGDTVDPSQAIWAEGKRVVVIGGGDTGSDCIGTCHRQGAVEVYQLELLPQPPKDRAESTPWPHWPMKLRTSHAHEEGGRRDWSVSTTSLSGEGGSVRRLNAVRVEMEYGANGPRFVEVPDSGFALEVDLVLLAMGFTGVQQAGLLADLGVAIGPRGAVSTDALYRTNVPGVFAAGDMRRGASLIVWAIREGRDAAASIDRHLRHAGASGSTRRHTAATSA
ncbi:MAG TPA: glutamate synthase subunit beta [Gemmatimonadaceae bacterium]|jgi:glutamate synthase (NADPH/NADH) small chain|nr:glutamate synthase subunit beta [Gemmatimonadaceae bacterium]